MSASSLSSTTAPELERVSSGSAVEVEVEVEVEVDAVVVVDDEVDEVELPGERTSDPRDTHARRPSARAWACASE